MNWGVLGNSVTGTSGENSGCQYRQYACGLSDNTQYPPTSQAPPVSVGQLRDCDVHVRLDTTDTFQRIENLLQKVWNISILTRTRLYLVRGFRLQTFIFCWRDFFSIIHRPLDKCLVREFLKANLCPQCLHVCFFVMLCVFLAMSNCNSASPLTELTGHLETFSFECSSCGGVCKALSINC